MKTITVGLFGVLAATAIGGAVTAALLVVPSATAAKDPCAASEVSRTVGKVTYSAGDYLDSHPQTNQAVTRVLQQPPTQQSIGRLNDYFKANPKAAADIEKITEPLDEVAAQCKLALNLPQMLGLLQAIQGRGVPLVGATPQPMVVG